MTVFPLREIKVLTEIANDFGEVWVVAPDGPMSGKGTLFP